MAIPSIAFIPSGYKINKIYSILPTNGDGDLDFTRVSTATRVNSSGLIENVATGVSRLDYSDGGCPSLLLEPQSTNLYLNSATLSTQNITTLASTYTVSFYGTGTVTFSGTFTGSLVGTGLNNRVKLTFTATAGTLASTISGMVTNAQIELRPYATSYIPTQGSTVTRIRDVASKTDLSSSIGQTEGVLYLEMRALTDLVTGSRDISLNSGNTANLVVFYYHPTIPNRVVGRIFANNASVYAFDLTLDASSSFNKMAISYTSSSAKVFLNGVLKSSSSPTILFSSPLNTLSFSSGNNTNNFEGKVKDLRVYNTALTDSELIDLTTL